MHLFLKCPKIEPSHFRFFCHFKIDHVFFLEMPHFFIFENLEMNLILKMGKWGISRSSNIKEWGIPQKKARDQFKNGKRTENRCVRFWGISKTNAYHMQHMPSRAKYILHILFGAFQVTPVELILYSL